MKQNRFILFFFKKKISKFTKKEIAIFPKNKINKNEINTYCQNMKFIPFCFSFFRINIFFSKKKINK